MSEEWKDIVGYEGLYKVSNTGKVMRLEREVSGKCGSIRHKPARLLKPSQGGKGACKGNGYLQVALIRDGKAKPTKIHRLVAEAFIPNPYLLPQVNHIDGNKLNNNVENLEWCDGYHNIRHAYAIGLKTPQRGESNGSHKLTQSAVDFIRSVYEPRTTRLGAQALAKAFGVDRHTIERAVKGESWKVPKEELANGQQMKQLAILQGVSSKILVDSGQESK